MPDTDALPTVEAVRAWLTERIAGQVGLPADQIRPDQSFADYGLDSVAALTVCAAVSDAFAVAVEPDDMWEHPTVDALGAVIRQRLTGARVGGEVRP